MKKLTTVLLGSMLTIGLTACGNNEAVQDNAAANNTSAAVTATASPAAEASAAPDAGQAAQSGPITVEELIQKSTEASDQLTSFAMDSNIVQNITIKQGEESQNQDVEMKMKSEFIKEPLQMHQTVQTNMAGQQQDVEQYITADGIYSYTNGRWVKLPAEMTEQITASIQQQADPEKQLEQFNTLTEYTKVTEEGDDYLLTAEVSGDSVKELAQTYMNQAAGGDNQMGALMEQMNIQSMTIMSAVNKETFLPTQTKVSMAMDMTAEGQSVEMQMNMDAAISRHNEITEIKVPEEALSAEEVTMPAAQ
ncbi:hypothetical protein C2I18_16390 [Paenibacillus sp. PK3_47]|uniref:DUF6612 family protein n=1 Tax=Paenibacillus sp. PK3_47 TaxID=2072642 RepID=UPI00201D463E|nr:DUF6612 family protein [Paenibacillus sp. PK3_47]UQZ34959.1 hypothetical protein C2I18_16390 [Paenibacillus sp. PK3_47]